MHSYSNSYNVFFLALVTLVLSMSFWFRDIISEGTGKLRLIQYIFNFFYLNTAKAIPIEDVKQALRTYNSNLHLYPKGEYFRASSPSALLQRNAREKDYKKYKNS